MHSSRLLRAGIIAMLCAAFGGGCSDSTPEEAPREVNLNNTDKSPNNVNNVVTGNNTNGQTNNREVPNTGSIDILTDANRNGRLDLEGDADQLGEATWDSESGAIFLPNIDDDDGSCPKNVGDLELASCFDGADETLDGPDDLKDLAPLIVRTIGELPSDIPVDTISVTLSATAGAEYFRVFDLSTQALVTLPATLDVAKLNDGIALGIEGKDVARDPAWDGVIALTVTMGWPDAPTGIETTDTVQLRIAPLVLRHHLDAATTVYSSELGIGGDGAYTQDLRNATTADGVPLGHVELPVQDQWAQDYFETGYVAMPAEGGLHTIEVFIRSANIEVDRFGNAYLREAGRFVFDQAGEDVAAVFALDPDEHSLEWDTLNSFGNTETIPPYSHDGRDFPVGRIIRGQAQNDRGDGGMRRMFEAQQVQDPLWIMTSWLLVGHVDETISFVPADNARGWVMLVNDARLAVQILEGVRNTNINASMFEGRAWLSNFGREYSAEINLASALEDPDIMSANAEAIVEVDAQIQAIRSATGLTDEEIIPVPFLHQDYNGYSTAYQPGMVNGLVPAAGKFWAPKPHGPMVDGGDVMEQAFQAQLAPLGIEITWIEDWDMFHRLNGEVHCGSNVMRAKPTRGWWEAMP